MFHCRCKELVHECDRETRQHCGGVLLSRCRTRKGRELRTCSGVGVGEEVTVELDCFIWIRLFSFPSLIMREC